MERTIAFLALRLCGFDVVRMEDFASADRDPWSVCVQELDGCDVFVLLLGRSYGSELPGTGRSYTHEEYERARDRGLPVFAFVKDGVERGGEDPSDALRLRDFYRWVAAAHVIREPHFRDGNELAESITAALSDWKPSEAARPAARRPRFSAAREAVSDPVSYAVGCVRRETLQRAPYRVHLVDTVLAREQRLSRQEPTRLLRKAIEIEREIADLGVDALFLNDIQAFGRDKDAVYEQRSALIASREGLAICLVQGESDYPLTRKLAGGSCELAILHPSHLPFADGRRTDGDHIPYDEPDVESCQVAKLAIDYVRGCLDEHLIEAFR